MTIFISCLVVEDVNVRAYELISWTERYCIIALFSPFSICDEIKNMFKPT